jgi:hypothetical protein
MKHMVSIFNILMVFILLYFYKFCEEKGLNPNHFEVQEQGLSYQEKKRIYFFDLFSFRKAQGKIARGVEFQEIVYEEAIPLDQEVLSREQWKLKDLVESLHNSCLFRAFSSLKNQQRTAISTGF